MANERDCENCKHHKEVCKNGIFYHSCESWDCEFEPKEDEEFEPKEDAISRQAAIDVLTKTGGIRGDALKVLYDLPSVTPQPEMGRWIPISEKLPSDGKYLVTRGDVIGRPMIGMRYFSKDLSKVDEYEFESKKGVSGWCEYDSEYGWYIDDKVTAWMPLPEPYKAEGSGEE